MCGLRGGWGSKIQFVGQKGPLLEVPHLPKINPGYKPACRLLTLEGSTGICRPLIQAIFSLQRPTSSSSFSVPETYLQLRKDPSCASFWQVTLIFTGKKLPFSKILAYFGPFWIDTLSKIKGNFKILAKPLPTYIFFYDWHFHALFSAILIKFQC